MTIYKKPKFSICTVRQKYHRSEIDRRLRCWISPNQLRNVCAHNYLEEWLKTHGHKHGHIPDLLPKTSIQQCYMQQGLEFELVVMKLISTACKACNLVLTENDKTLSLQQQADFTRAALKSKAHVIVQPLLFDAEERLFGYPDLLVRSDVLKILFDCDSKDNEPEYVAVEVKRTNFSRYQTAAEFINLGGCKFFNKIENPIIASIVQLYIYANCLARHLNSTFVQNAYVICPRDEWLQNSVLTIKPSAIKLSNLMIAKISLRSSALCRRVYTLIDWIRTMRYEGSDWLCHKQLDSRLKSDIEKASPKWIDVIQKITLLTPEMSN